jgi:hypothetical protein
MPDDFLKLIFIGVLSMQYHPRNEILPADDDKVIERCLLIAEKAHIAFSHHFPF